MPLDFQRLILRLVWNLEQRVRSGEISERSLARVAGLSQPHLHHVLKGERHLSIAMADQILRRLHLDLRDLMGPDEPLK